MKCDMCDKPATTLWDDYPRCDDHPCKCGQCSPIKINKEPTLKDLTWQDMWQRLIDAGWLPHEADEEIASMKQDEEGTP